MSVFRGGEYGRRTPVESREKRDAGILNDVVVPVLLALAISAAVGALWVALLVMLRAVGDHVYWLTVVVGGTFIFFAPLLTRWRYRDEATIFSAVAGGLLTAALGWLATALWRLTRDLTWGELFTTVPVVSLPVGVLWLIISTFQESFFRSPFMEQAIGNVVGGENGPWWKPSTDGLGEVEPEVIEPEVVVVKWTDVEENGGLSQWRRLEFPLGNDDARWLAGHLLSGGNLSIPQCSGKGRPLSRTDVGKVQDWLIAHGFGNWEDPEQHSLGFNIKAAGRKLFKELKGQL